MRVSSKYTKFWFIGLPPKTDINLQLILSDILAELKAY